MSSHPKIQLSVLRQIGWDHWDPIGLRHVDDGAWRNDAADEYDSYLLHVVSMLRRGQSEAEGAAYLVRIASETMGLGKGFAADDVAAAKTVAAIADYLRPFPIGPLRVR